MGFNFKQTNSKPAILVGQGTKNKKPFSMGVLTQEKDKKPLVKENKN